MQTPEQLEQLLKSIENADAVALDTEFINFPWHKPKLELIQIATPDYVAAVDYQQLQNKIKPLLKVLITKKLVVHMAKYDVMLILMALGLSPTKPPKLSIFDTQVASAFLGNPNTPLLHLDHVILS